MYPTAVYCVPSVSQIFVTDFERRNASYDDAELYDPVQLILDKFNIFWKTE